MRILALLIAALLAAPGAMALFEGYGAVVEGDAPSARLLVFDGPHEFVFLDDNRDGVLNAGEHVFLARSVRLEAGDVWLTDGGRRITGTDGVTGSTAVAGAGTLAFLSERGQDHFAPGDLLVLDASGAGAGQLSGSDLILTGEHAGTFAALAGIPLNAALTPLAAPVGYVDDGTGVYGGQPLWFDTNGDGAASPVDVRAAGARFGEVARADDDDVSLHLRQDNGPTVWAYIDEGGTQSYRPGDHLFLARDAQVGVGSVRLVATSAGEAGFHVRGGDGDAYAPRQVLQAQLAVVGGDAHIDVGEFLVLDITSIGQAGVLDASDIILSGEHAGKSAGEAGVSSGSPLFAVAAPKYVDLDGDRRFSLGDLAYYDADSSGFVSRGDVQLVTVEGLQPSPEVSEPEPEPEPTPPETETPAPEPTPPPTERDEAVPAVLPIAGLLIALLRRR